MLKGKTALATGSTGGIGLGIALALARQGAKLMFNGFGGSEGPLAQVRAHRRDRGSGACWGLATSATSARCR